MAGGLSDVPRRSAFAGEACPARAAAARSTTPGPVDATQLARPGAAPWLRRLPCPESPGTPGLPPAIHGGLFLLGRIDDLPIPLHVDHVPIPGLGLFQGLFRALVVGVFPLGVGVVHEQGQPGPLLADGGPLEHLLVAVGIAASGDGPATDVGVDAHGLARLVVDEGDLRQAHDDRAVRAHLVLRFDARTDDLLERHAVDRLGPGAHELDAAAGNDEGLEAVGAQIRQKFEHGLVDHLRVELPRLWMAGRGDPVLDHPLEVRRGHACLGGHGQCDEGLVAAGQHALEVPLKDRGEGFLSFPFRMLWGKGLDPVQNEVDLEIERFFGPERAVVVKGGDALRHGHEIRRPFAGYLVDEGGDGRLVGAVVPGGQGMGRLGEGEVAYEQCENDECGGEKAAWLYGAAFHGVRPIRGWAGQQARARGPAGPAATGPGKRLPSGWAVPQGQAVCIRSRRPSRKPGRAQLPLGIGRLMPSFLRDSRIYWKFWYLVRVIGPE